MVYGADDSPEIEDNYWRLSRRMAVSRTVYACVYVLWDAKVLTRVIFKNNFLAPVFQSQILLGSDIFFRI